MIHYATNRDRMSLSLMRNSYRSNSSNDINDEYEREINDFLNFFEGKVPELYDALNKSLIEETIPTSYNSYVNIFGSGRLRILEIFLSLLKARRPSFDKIFSEIGAYRLLLVIRK